MDYYTLDRKSVADMLKVSLRTLDRYVAKNTFSTEKRNGKLFFHLKEVEDFLQDRSIEGIDTNFATQSTRLERIQSAFLDSQTPEFKQDSMAKEVSKHPSHEFSELEKKFQKHELEAKMYKNMYETSQQLFASQQEQLQSAHYRLGKLEEKVKLLPSPIHVEQKQMQEVKHQTKVSQLEKTNIRLRYDIEKNSFMRKFYLLFSVAVVFGVSLVLVIS